MKSEQAVLPNPCLEEEEEEEEEEDIYLHSDKNVLRGRLSIASNTSQEFVFLFTMLSVSGLNVNFFYVW
jgi:hypothetical protein